MTQKKFERDSKFASDWDLDGDGLVSDAEVESSKQIKQTETELRRHLAQLRMARFTLAAMGAFTLAMFFIPLERVEAWLISRISSLAAPASSGPTWIHYTRRKEIMLGVLASILGNGDVIKKGMDLIDDVHSSDEEMERVKAQAKIDTMAAYAPFKVAQRYLALMFTATFWRPLRLSW